MKTIQMLAASAILAAVLWGCAAYTPPTPTAPAVAVPPAGEIVLPESLPMDRNTAQAMYLMVKGWRNDRNFIENGYEGESPYSQWMFGLEPIMYCEPGPGCPREDITFLRRLTMLTMVYRMDGDKNSLLINDLEAQIEHMLQFWKHNPEYMIPEGAEQEALPKPGQ